MEEFIQSNPIFLNDRKLNVKIIRSKNKNGYATVKKSDVIIKIPYNIHGTEYEKMTEELYRKVKKYVLKHHNKLTEEDVLFYDGKITNPMNVKLKISTVVLDIKQPMYTLNTGNILISLPENIDSAEYPKMTENLAIRAICNSMYAFVLARVNIINNKFFNSDITEVKIKLTRTMWGSMSSNNVMTINMKLLYVPSDVLDYVIIHELSHTKVRNHSERFWKTVERAMPDYKEKKIWLKKHRSLTV